MTQFEADLDPASGAPRIRFNLPNGWSFSIVLVGPDDGKTRYKGASIAWCPSGRWGMGETEGFDWCSAGEVVAILAEICMRPAPPAAGGLQ